MPPDFSIYDGAFQVFLAVGFTIASVLLFMAATRGRAALRWIRCFGGGLSAGKATFYVMAAGGSFGDMGADYFHFLADFARTLNFGLLALFFLWAKLSVRGRI